MPKGISLLPFCCFCSFSSWKIKAEMCLLLPKSLGWIEDWRGGFPIYSSYFSTDIPYILSVFTLTLHMLSHIFFFLFFNVYLIYSFYFFVLISHVFSDIFFNRVFPIKSFFFFNGYPILFFCVDLQYIFPYILSIFQLTSNIFFQFLPITLPIFPIDFPQTLSIFTPSQ